jgi:hypothetical protein
MDDLIRYAAYAACLDFGWKYDHLEYGYLCLLTGDNYSISRKPYARH